MAMEATVKYRVRLRSALLCSLLVTVPACATMPLAAPETAQSFIYRLGPGDRLRITTYGEPALSGEFAVSGSGTLAFPLIGDVAVAGKPASDVRDEIRARLGAQYLRNPNLTVEIVNFRPVFILGEVAKSGEFPYAERMTVFTLIARAGGFTYRANRKIVFIRRESEVEERAYQLTGSLSIQPGDTVRIGERYF